VRSVSELLGATLPPPCPATQPGGFGVIDEPDRDISAFGHNAALFSALKYSVVRIQTDSKTSSGTEEAIGSGWVVNATATMSDPFDYTIITNAHVVRSAGNVRVQLPSLGRMTFEATVPMICFGFDLAVVKITNTSELRASLEAENIRVKLLNLRTKNVKMGMKVAALGFSLGSQWLKLSEGVIAGAEAVDQNMVYQSTAPISPGNSGGPLLLFQKRDGVQSLDSVIGVNFASSASKEAQNLNYAIPAFRVLQVLMAYQKQREALSCGSLDSLGSGTKAHMQLRIPPVGLTYAQSTKAQLKKSKCEKGIQLAKFSKYSIFRYADPPIRERHILTHVDNTSLDIFGMGKRLDFIQADVSFMDLLTFRTSLSDAVQVTTCSGGVSRNHTLSLEWNTSRYEPGIRFVYEPEFDAAFKDYESFAGLTMTQLTQNDIEGWLKSKTGQTLARFQLEEYMRHPRVAISACEAGATCDYVLNAGMIVEKVNGCNVTTMADIRRCFVPRNGSLWEMVTDRGYILQADFDTEVAKEVEKANKDPNLLSKAVASASGLITTSTTTIDYFASTSTSMEVTTSQLGFAAAGVESNSSDSSNSSNSSNSSQEDNSSNSSISSNSSNSSQEDNSSNSSISSNSSNSSLSSAEDNSSPSSKRRRRRKRKGSRKRPSLLKWRRRRPSAGNLL